MRKLSKQQKNFITEYIKTLDGEQSAKRAGYKSKNLKEIVDRLLGDERIIKEIKHELNSQVLSLRVQRGYVIQKLLRIAEFSMQEEDILDKEGNPTGKIKLRDTSAALKALEGICKHLGLNDRNSQEGLEAKIITICNLDDNKI